MHRRAALRAIGLVTAAGVAGCLGGDEPTEDDSDGPAETGDTADDASGAEDDGGSDDVPHEAANAFDYPTMPVQGVNVPLVPNDDALEWHTDDDAVFVDTRTREEYDRLRIAGAVFSPAPDGLSEDDPVADLATETRIVTYCACPHTLAGLRASSLIAEGYVHTYALDDGIPEWDDAGYPVEES